MVTGDGKEFQMRLAAALSPGMTAQALCSFDEHGGDYAAFAELSCPDLSKIVEADMGHCRQVHRQEGAIRATREMQFLSRSTVRAVLATDPDYPERLLQLYNAPAVIFTLGRGNLSAPHPLAVVGTRKPTPQGAKHCTDFVNALADSVDGLNIVSGLAYGIDSLSHSAALQKKVTTTAVLAHGLDMVYPAAHRDLASAIVHSGGVLVSQYPSGEKPRRQRFLERNRIIAALCDGTLVVESAQHGGSLSTANTAFELDREVFAIPGRIDDEMSQGCNLLIHRNKAQIALSADTLIDAMGWQRKQSAGSARQGSLFPELTSDQKLVVDILKSQQKDLTIDIISTLAHMSIPRVMVALSELEELGIALRQPGNRFTNN